jgi:hypothetical protein
LKIGHGWHPYVKSDGTLVIRTKGANRSSTRVEEINEKLKSVSKKCADKPLDEFRSCVAEELTDTKASGSDAPSYVYAKAHKTQGTRESGMTREKIIGGHITRTPRARPAAA